MRNFCLVRVTLAKELFEAGTLKRWKSDVPGKGQDVSAFSQSQGSCAHTSALSLSLLLRRSRDKLVEVASLQAKRDKLESGMESSPDISSLASRITCSFLSFPDMSFSIAANCSNVNANSADHRSQVTLQSQGHRLSRTNTANVRGGDQSVG